MQLFVRSITTAHFPALLRLCKSVVVQYIDQAAVNQRTDKKKQKYGLFVDDFVYVWSVDSVGALVRAFAALNAGYKWA